MSKKDREKKRKNREKKKMAFWDQKSSTLSAFIVLAAMINECLDTIFNCADILKYVYIGEIVLLILLFGLLLCTPALDKMMNSEKIRKATAYLTVSSIIFFILCLLVKISVCSLLAKIVLGIFVLEVVGLLVYLLYDI